MTLRQKFIKRFFDIFISLIGICLVWWIIAIAYFIAAIDTRSSGFFIQNRVGRNGKLFPLLKIRTMHTTHNNTSTITTSNDLRISQTGRFFRKTKIDELPQLFNVLIGHMSLVGPRPDVVGYADQLSGDDALILSLRPGITGPASLKYRNEEEILASQKDPKRYNDDIIWPDKVQINRHYLDEWSFFGDLKYLWRTIAT